MKTTVYNPSPLETELTDILCDLKDEISSKLSDNQIISITADKKRDNPDLLFVLEDKDGDKHEIVVQIIQRAEE